MQEAASPTSSSDIPVHLIARVARYRPLLWLLAVFGFFVLNGTYLYFAAMRPEVLSEAMHNPISLVFMAEAFVLLVFAAWLIAQSRLRRPGWIVFVALSLAGGLVFSIPAFLLQHLRRQTG